MLRTASGEHAIASDESNSKKKSSERAVFAAAASPGGARRALALDEQVHAVTKLTAPRGCRGAVPPLYEIFLETSGLFIYTKNFKRELLYQQQGELAIKHANYEQAVAHFDKAIEANPQNPDYHLQRAYAHMGMDEFDQSLNDYRMYITYDTHPRPTILSNTIDFTIGFAQNVPKGAVESGRQLTAFAADLISHPIDASCNVCCAFATLAELACTQQWAALSESIAPEVCQLANEWNSLTAREQGERAGYIFGKYGGDILIPGATAKVLSKGIEGAKDVVLAAKNLQTAEQTFALEALAQSASRAGVLEDFPVQFKNAEGIEVGVEEITVSKEQCLQEQAFWESNEKYKKARESLQPYRNEYLPENKIRELIQQAGLPTFPRPQGIPENFRVKLSDKGGMEYVHPSNNHIRVRVMPGKPHSPNPLQQNPYVVYSKNGKAVDKLGNLVDLASPEAHIPINEFDFSRYDL